MKFIEWIRPGIRINGNVVGYSVKGDRMEYDEMLSWCTECFGDKSGSHPDDYRWNSSMSSWGNTTMEGYFHFRYEVDAMAFKLRWL